MCKSNYLCNISAPLKGQGQGVMRDSLVTHTPGELGSNLNISVKIEERNQHCSRLPQTEPLQKKQFDEKTKVYFTLYGLLPPRVALEQRGKGTRGEGH